MSSPDGDIVNDNSGCFLEVVENERLVWTGALGPDFRPNDFAAEGVFPFTAVLTLRSGRRRNEVHRPRDARHRS